MDPNETDLRQLEQLIGRLTTSHARLAELVERQRRAIRQADPAALADVGARIESQVNAIAELETRRRGVCQRLGSRLGLPADQAARARLETFSDRVGGRWGERLRESADRLARQLDRVGRAGRVNQVVARKLNGFFADLLGRIGRLGRETGCYDARGRPTLARESIGLNCFSTVG